jgi:hypothetical protein
VDQIDRLILEVKGQQQLEALNAQLVKERENLAELIELQAQTQSGQSRGDAVIRASAERIRDLNEKIKDLRGTTGAGGSGILGASYAVQDFITVLQGGQGLERALMSVSNNVPQVAAALGAGAGLAGQISLVFTGITALIPVVKSMWDAFGDGEAAAAARERIREIRKEIADAVKEFQELRDTPTEFEKRSAEGVKLFLGERPNAERAKSAVSAGLSNAEAYSAMGEGERKQFGDLEATATLSDEQVLARAQQAIGESVNPVDLRNAIADVRRDRETAQRTRDRLLRQARERKAAAIVAGATEAGPKGAQARGRLLELTRGKPGFGFLEGITPEALEAQERDYEENIVPAFEEAVDSGRAATRATRRRLAREKRAAARAKQAKARLDRSREQEGRDQEPTAEEVELGPAVEPFDAARGRNAGYFDVPFEPGGQNAEYWRGVRLTREGQRAGLDDREAGRRALLRLQEERRAAAARRDEEGGERAARGMIGGIAQHMGATLTPDQLNEAARRAVDMTRAGLDMNSAALSAFRQQMERMARMQGQLMQQAQRWGGMMQQQGQMFPGAGDSGMFPMPGGGM